MEFSIYAIIITNTQKTTFVSILQIENLIFDEKYSFSEVFCFSGNSEMMGTVDAGKTFVHVEYLEFFKFLL